MLSGCAGSPFLSLLFALSGGGHAFMNSNSNKRYVPDVTPIELQILFALLYADQHGLGLIQDIANRTQNEIFLSPGTLYSALKRMYKAGLIGEGEEVPPADDGNADRRRYYRLNKAGFEAIQNELERMQFLLQEMCPPTDRAGRTGYPLNMSSSKESEHHPEAPNSVLSFLHAPAPYSQSAPAKSKKRRS